ncbi:hypothetical protein ACHHYP_00695 [Achlya hypogyna]|uniref:Uncharacterized protein n=1 Tax=Achlya hypogyna TaxID=1202772 RepID=A0A1V9ZU30_ACHHY|nr:hypothetical protein ACHHYP_00695 [Achlya hypogyna]
MAATQALDTNIGWRSRGASRVVGATYLHGTQGHLLITASDQVVRVNSTKFASGVAVQVQSWDFRPDSAQAISVAAVKHAKKDTYYAVRGKAKTELITWANETEKLSATLPSVPLPSAASELLVHPHLDGVLAVCASGSMHLFESALKTVVPEPKATKGKAKPALVYAAINSDSAHQLHVVTITKLGNKYDVTFYQLDAASAKATVLRKDTVESADAFVSATYHCKDAAVSVLWASGRWESVSADGVKDLASLAAAPAGEAKRRKVTTVAFQTCEAAPNAVAVASTSDVSVWDAKFGACLARHTLPAEASGHGALLRVFKFPAAHLALAYEKAVVVTTVEAPTSTLAAVLGKSAAPAPTALLLSTHIGVSDMPVVVPALQVETWPHQMLVGNEEQKAVLEQLTSPEKTPTKEAFAAVFNKYVFNNAKQTKIRGVLSPLFVTQVAARCLASPELGLWRELKLLLRSRHLCSRALPALIPTLLQHKQLGLLDVALRCLADVDEVSSVRIIKFVLRNATEQSVALYQAQSKDTSVATPAQLVDHFLHLVVRLPKSETFLQQALTQLKLPDVLALLALLKKWYRRPDSDVVAVVEWLGLLLDVHFASLVLASSSHPDAIGRVVRDTQAIVVQHLDACTFMADVHGELDQLLSGAHLPQTGAIPDYSVQTLKM